MRAPVAATGGRDCSRCRSRSRSRAARPRMRVDATAIDANASLISTRSTSSTVTPARSSAFGIASVGPRPVSRRRHSDRRPRPHDRQRLEPVRLGVVASATTIAPPASLSPDEFPAVIAEPVDLRMQRRQRGELLQRRVTARVLVDRRTSRLALAPRPAPRSAKISSRSRPSSIGGDRRAVRVVRPVVLLLAA